MLHSVLVYESIFPLRRREGKISSAALPAGALLA